MSYDEVKGLFLAKEGNALIAERLQSFEEVNAAIWDVKAEVFLPCAASRLVTQNQVERMIAAGVEVISSGANVPFADAEIFYGPIAEYADHTCGHSRLHRELWHGAGVRLSDERRRRGHVGRRHLRRHFPVIRKALAKVKETHPDATHFTAKAFERALGFLM